MPEIVNPSLVAPAKKFKGLRFHEPASFSLVEWLGGMSFVGSSVSSTSHTLPHHTHE
jgi:hypothetical protein